MSAPAEIVQALDEPTLEAWLRERRWFASKSRELQGVHVLDVLTLRAEDAPLVVALVEARFHAGTHELYQLVLTLGDGATTAPVAEVGAVAVIDALAEPEAAAELGELLLACAEIEGPASRVRFLRPGGATAGELPRPVRALGAEQSNSSIVFADALILKCFRKLEAGENPELEMLRFLDAHGFRHIAPLEGWYEYRGELLEATLGVAQRFVSGRDGWEVALEDLASDPDRLTARLHALGRVIGEMHRVLGSDGGDADFAPEEKGGEAVALIVATIDEEIRRAFEDLPEDDERFAPIAGRGQELRDRLAGLARIGAGGMAIRTHGDLHLGQTLLRPDDAWVILDFEGEPARPLLERRRRRSPLRDVAGMLRSIAYVAVAARDQRGADVPEGWVDEARTAFTGGYHETVDAALLPGGENARTLIAIFELEKAVYELAYERDNRPEWVGIPVAGIARILDEDVTA
jgi:trehalose synthase-fused probable maltokinase